MKFFKILILVFVIIAIISFFVFDRISYIRIKNQAKDNYLNSRLNITFSDTYNFISKGIKYNMSEECVNTIMEAAGKKLYNLHQYSPRWNGYVNIYIFKYGPPWINPITKKEIYCYEEWFWVYFDNGGKAKEIRREMVKGDDFMEYKNVKIDLKTETIKNL